jgi:hypothetical protein
LSQPFLAMFQKTIQLSYLLLWPPLYISIHPPPRKEQDQLSVSQAATHHSSLQKPYYGEAAAEGVAFFVGVGGGGHGVVVLGAVAGGAAAGVLARRRQRGSRGGGYAAGARRGAVGAAVRGDLRGGGGRDAAQHQRQVRRPLHPGEEPACPRPRRRLPRTRPQDHHAIQAQVEVVRRTIGVITWRTGDLSSSMSHEGKHNTQVFCSVGANRASVSLHAE